MSGPSFVRGVKCAKRRFRSGTMEDTTANPLTPRLEKVIDEFKRSGLSSIIGADSAWRGFMLQALYVSARITGDTESAAYMLETVEDLAVVRDAGTEKERIELIQIKSKQGDPLALSHLKPKKLETMIEKDGSLRDDSFFGHVWLLWSKGFDVSAKVVAFGDVGKELLNVSENLKENNSLRKKLVEGHGYDDAFCEWLSNNLTVERVEETILVETLESSLREHAETRAAIELAEKYLMAYMYDCCRSREVITPEVWRGKLRGIGVQAASAQGYLGNYGRTIVPLSEYLSETMAEDLAKLRGSYRAGVSAIPQHITMGLDIARPKWQEAISEALAESSVAVVRAASGQGKSTTCYRWLVDCGNVGNVYLLTGITRDNYAGIASALRGLAKGGGSCIGYVEADSNEGWVALCEEVNRLNMPGLRLLVSVREDDAARAGYSASKAGAKDVFLRFDKGEARELYDLSGTTQFPSFEAAWRCFGEGPLMEFTYSLDHRTGLRSRLEQQVGQMRQNGEDGWLEFLYLACRAGEYGLASSIADLIEASGCRNPQRMLAVMEDELLLRSDSERGVVVPLHPHRSKLLARIISPTLYEDEESLTLEACRCAHGDFGPILVEYLYEHDMSERGMAALVSLAGRSWASSAYALRAMVWKDARAFFQSSENLLSEISNLGLPVTLGAMLAGGATERPEPESWGYLLKLIGEEDKREGFGKLVEALAGRTTGFVWTNRFLNGVAASLPPVSMCAAQPHDAGFVLAYIGERGFAGTIHDAAAARLASLGFGDVSLEGALDLAVGISCTGISVGEGNVAFLRARICRRDHIVWLNEDELVERSCLESDGKPYGEIPAKCLGEGGLVRQLSAIVVPNFEEPDADVESIVTMEGQDMSPNGVVMRAVCDLRRLYPDRGRYCVRYAGIKALVGGLEIPDCEKHIPEKNLRLNWLKLINRYYLAMCSLIDGPSNDWADLRQSIKAAVSDSVNALRLASELMNAVASRCGSIHKKQKAFGIAASKAKEELDSLNVDLPTCARDPYGFGSGQLGAFASMSDGDFRRLESGNPAYGVQKGSAAILPATKKLVFQLQIHFNRINEMISYAAGMAGRPDQSAVYVISEACALISGSERELAAMFSQDTRLFSKGQKEALLQHAAYWNHIWSHGPTGSGRVLLLQKARTGSLSNISSKLVALLGREPGVVSVALSGDKLSVEYATDSQDCFPVFFARCFGEALGFDPHKEERLFELCMLRDSSRLRVEVFFTHEGERLLKREYKLIQLVDNLNNPERVDAFGQTKLQFDESNPQSEIEAAIVAKTSINTCERLMEAASEIRTAFADSGQGSQQVVVEEWSNWCRATLALAERLCDQIEGALRLMHRQDELMDEVNELRISVCEALRCSWETN